MQPDKEASFPTSHGRCGAMKPSAHVMAAEGMVALATIKKKNLFPDS